MQTFPNPLAIILWTMKASNILIAAIKQFEGFRSVAYKCPAGVWTVGYGTTRGVHQGTKVTEELAEAWLRSDLSLFEDGVAKLTAGLNLPQHQFDALVDFAYNCGLSNLSTSTLLRYIKAKRSTADICNQFRRWNKAGGKVLPGLIKRREWECNRWKNIV